ncbi:Protein of unknown function [Sporobacter termitidis DSM 10068]|uniref:DUF4004 domain-containing protein n=1 Tax=Sporobacter termitidis DSM 10068 TaxID=1123282 RepID=A0A1M5ZA90_9FIRM|nr:YhbD family protein [Sporobacter termitidis]SHI21119.1 Protein of unknown function [Sporobacter termitidis DSM 10068]
MEEELISKKELLDATDISYGQLYRWKRKGLIPEDWFIKKSSFTGQETYFPRQKVLSRIEKIKSMKEDVSLDELADVFTPTLSEVALDHGEIVSRGIASAEVLRIFLEEGGGGEMLSFPDLAALFLLNRLIVAGDIGLEEGKTLLDVMTEAAGALGLEACEVFLTRKLGVFSCFIVKPPCSIVTDKGVKIIGRQNMAALIEEIKLKLI